MDPTRQFCHRTQRVPHCPMRGQVGQGNIGVHSQRDRRYVCRACGKTFSATKGTTYYRLRTAVDIVTLVLVLVCHGCPLQAIVAAFGLDERAQRAPRLVASARGPALSGGPRAPRRFGTCGGPARPGR